MILYQVYQIIIRLITVIIYLLIPSKLTHGPRKIHSTRTEHAILKRAVRGLFEFLLKNEWVL